MDQSGFSRASDFEVVVPRHRFVPSFSRSFYPQVNSHVEFCGLESSKGK